MHNIAQQKWLSFFTHNVYLLDTRFPTDEERRKQWAIKIRRIDDSGHVWQPTQHSVVCSEHFAADDFYMQWSRKLIKADAVPTLFSFSTPQTKRKPPRARASSCSTFPSTSFAETVSTATCVASEASETPTVVNPSLTSAFHSYALSSPSKLKKQADTLRDQLRKRITALRNARRRETRLRGTVCNLLSKLRQRKLLSDYSSELLCAYEDIPLDLFRKRTHGSYSARQKQFATTLHYYSPAAYSYVRSELKSLPNPRTIRRWLSACQAEPGLTQQSYDTVANGVKGDNANAFKICALHLDEMEIKSQIDYDRKSGKIYGFTDIGCGPLNDDSQPQAKKVLMVVAVGITGYWKLPLAYYLTDGATADLQTSVLKDNLTKLWECGCVAVSVTFDGLSANQKTLINLGGCLQPDNIVSTFPHPCMPNFAVAVIFDACHMIKLARNLFHEYQIVTVDGIGKAKWQHVEKLHKLQQSEGLTLANKLTNQHVMFKTQKMKVRLAVQVISASCVAALEFLRTNDYPGFHDTMATEILLSTLDKLFDSLNCRSKHATGYKGAINRRNMEYKLDFLSETEKFLLRLADSNGKKLVDTRRRTCIIGFCATIKSINHLVNELLMSESGVNGVRLDYLLTYKFSQDHIETMFGVIRRRFGWNNNPTAMQFRYAYRAILNKICVMPSSAGNVVPLDTTDDLTDQTVVDDDIFTDSGSDILLSEGVSALSHYADNVSVYIAGFVIRKLMPKLKCSECRELLVGVANAPSAGFLHLKDNGGLVKPSDSVIWVVQQAERYIRFVVSDRKPAHSLSRLGMQLEHAVLKSIDVTKLFGNTNHAIESSNGIENHTLSLVRLIVQFYLDIRKFHILKCWNIARKGVNVRQSLTKTILFKHQ